MAGGTTDRVAFAQKVISGEEWNDIRNKETVLWVIGKIVYDDDQGNHRRTGFARYFSMDTGRFHILKDDADYEYQD